MWSKPWAWRQLMVNTERATHEGAAFRYLEADQHPDHVTIADFRKEHVTALSQLFVQVFQLRATVKGVPVV
jgi:hypothetical protein